MQNVLGLLLWGLTLPNEVKWISLLRGDSDWQMESTKQIESTLLEQCDGCDPHHTCLLCRLHISFRAQV